MTAGEDKPLREAGRSESQALKPLGEMSKRVPPSRGVTSRATSAGRYSRLGNEEGGATGGSKFSASAFTLRLVSIPRRKTQVSPRASNPAQMEGPERSARPAKI